jgi:hypothetical protein
MLICSAFEGTPTKAMIAKRIAKNFMLLIIVNIWSGEGLRRLSEKFDFYNSNNNSKVLDRNTKKQAHYLHRARLN